MTRRTTLFADRRRLVRRVTVLGIVPVLVLAGFMAQGNAVSGNIGSAAIQIDADLYDDTGTPQNTGAAEDWVKDSDANEDTGCLSDSVASCNEAGVTAAASGTGHWYGARIVDGVAQGDQDIFRTGGKENDTSTWNVGAGSVGSSKYDITQAYLANNSSTLYFGMERRGNNGTTAFDFEFNQAAPENSTTYVPTRSNGDKLFTFEMSGSGSSGSATPHVFTWSGDEDTQVGAYAEDSNLSGVLTAINNAAVPAAPWGFVNSKGQWVTGDLERFEFAEAAVNLATVFSGFDACGTAPYYAQVRTRSSATATSDLKDTTKIFEYSFSPGAAPTASKLSASASALSATLTSTADSGTTRLWQKTTDLTADPQVWTDISGATSSTYTYSGFDTDVPLSGAPTVAYDTGVTTVGITGTTNANGSYVGKVQTVYFRVKVTKTANSCVTYSAPAAVNRVVLVDP